MTGFLLLGSVPIHVIILFSCLFIVQAQDPILRQCPTQSNFTSNSPFQTNRNRLLSSLVANGSRDGFYNTTIGSAPDTAYGLVSCRGDLSMEDCRACLNTSTAQAPQLCPNGSVANIRYENCLLRYSNRSFFSQVVHSLRYIASGRNVSDADRALYNRQLGNLMRTLSRTAASSQARYNSGSTNFTDFNDIYGSAQCTRDLSPTSCFSCLQTMFTYIPTCCTGRRGARIFSTTCSIRYELYSFVQVPPASPSPLPPSPPPPPASVDAPPLESIGNGRGGSTNVVAITVPTVAAVLLLAICAYLIVRRNKTKHNPDIIYDRDDIRSEESLQFDLNTVKIATNDFSDANKLGEGGFGAVYRGELLDGQEIAVKRLSKNSGQGSQEFKNEVVLLHKLQHRNLVRLLGFCLAGEEKLLIYEYVPNTSLDKYIFVSTKKAELDWDRRYKIIGGIARGLLYLHEDSRL